MRRTTIKRLLISSLFLTVSLSILWLNKNVFVKAEEPAEMPESIARINQLAKEARTGSNIEANQELVTAAIEVAGFENELRGFTLSAIKDRVARADIRYRQEGTSGISEDRVVQTVNGLAMQLDLPEYTKTNSYEVRRLRVALLPQFPQLITISEGDLRDNVMGSQISAEMSPTEAVFVLGMLLQQKLGNPEFQLTSQERVNTWAEDHRLPNGSYTRLRDNQGRGDEIRRALRRAATEATFTDALRLSTMTMNTLGIDQ